VPVVLRKRDKKNRGSYLFINEVYIYRKIDGKVITALMNKELTKQIVEFKMI